MKTIYIDENYMCYLEDGDNRTSVETDAFDETVDEAIIYYRYIPQNAEWTDPKSKITFHGPFIQATDSNAIDRAIQQAYIADMKTALEILGVTE